MTPAPRTRWIVAAVAALGVLAGGAGASAAGRPPSCQAAKSKTLHQNSLARVFARPSATGGTQLVGCWRKTGRRRVLASGDGAQGGARLVRLAGRHVAFYDEASESCGPNCASRNQTRRITRVDLRSGRRVVTVVRLAPARLLLNAHGEMAWVQPAAGDAVELLAYDARREHLVDSGAIVPASVRLEAGGRLRWANAGVSRSTQLSRSGG